MQIKQLEVNAIVLAVMTEDGRIAQLGMSALQRAGLDAFLAQITKDSPLVKLSEQNDFVLKSQVRKMK